MCRDVCVVKKESYDVCLMLRHTTSSDHGSGRWVIFYHLFEFCVGLFFPCCQHFIALCTNKEIKSRLLVTEHYFLLVIL